MHFQKISILPSQKGLEIPGKWGVPKTKKIKEMYEVELEFPEGRRDLIKKSLLWGRYGYFMELHKSNLYKWNLTHVNSWL